MSWRLLQNSLLISAASAALGVVLGTLSALWTASLRPRWRFWVLGAAVVALALPPFLVTNCWLYLLGHTGVWRNWVPFGIYSLWGTIWILSLLTWPITLFLVLGAWQRIQPSHLESEPLLRGWAMIRWLLIPAANTALGLGAVLTFVLSLNNFAVPAILQTKVLASELWLNFSTTFDYGTALVLAWPLVLGPMILLLWLNRREIPWSADEGGASHELFRRRLGKRWRRIAGITTMVLILLTVALPLAQLIGSKRTWMELPAALGAAKNAAWSSFVLGAAAATISVLLSLFVWPWRLGVCLWIPFLVPGVLVGIALIYLLNRPLLEGFYHSVGIAILGFVLRYLAVSWSSATHGMRSLDADLTASARLSGASTWQTLRYVQWPQIAPLMAAAWYITYLFCLWDVETLVLTVPPGGETLALRIFGLLHYGWNTQVDALCLVLLGLALLPLLLWGAGRWLGRTTRPASLLLFSPQGRGPRSAATPSTRNSSFAKSRPWMLPLPAGEGWGEGESSAHPSGSGLSSVFTLTLALSLMVEGTKSATPPSSRNARLAEPRPFTLPLPAGEGWGEGESPAHPSGSGSSSVFTLTLALSLKGEGTKSAAPPSSWSAWLIGPRPTILPINCKKRLTFHNTIAPLFSCALLASAAVGCLPPASNGTRIESQFFGSVKVIGSRGTGSGQFNKPRSLVVDGQDNLYVVDMTGRVQKFSPDGSFLFSWQMPQTDLGKPKGMCLDREGNVVVIEPHYGRVNHFSTEGKLAAQWGDPGTNRGQLMFPRAAAVNSRGEIFVSEYGKVERVQKFSGLGRAFLTSFGEAGSGPSHFNRPEGLGIDRQDRLSVADSCNHRIQVFSPDGQFLRTYGKAGSAAGELSYPYDVQVDAEGRQYVCEFGNSRVQVFDEAGKSLEILGGAGSEPGRFNNPWSVALDSKGNLYVADSQNHRVQKFLRKQTSVKANARNTP
ncbi:MAG: hypothetical protein HY735_23630 [Verrucomicrobia bacterium]|nr:hypothetical protein [Verrucomicrobiota bacterium]